MTFRAALLLLVGPGLGFNVDRLAARTNVPRSMAAVFTRRWFDNGVWQSGGPVYPWSTPHEPEFWNDVAVAEGKLCRRGDRLDTIEWAAPGKWRKSYDFVSKPNGTLNVAYTAEDDQPSAPEVSDSVTPDELEDATEPGNVQAVTPWRAEAEDDWEETEEEAADHPVESPAPDQSLWIGGSPPDVLQPPPAPKPNVWIGGEPGELFPRSVWLI